MVSWSAPREIREATSDIVWGFAPLVLKLFVRAIIPASSAVATSAVRSAGSIRSISWQVTSEVELAVTSIMFISPKCSLPGSLSMLMIGVSKKRCGFCSKISPSDSKSGVFSVIIRSYRGVLLEKTKSGIWGLKIRGFGHACQRGVTRLFFPPRTPRIRCPF